ncbi:unnamed protein product [Rhizophagus irregularis]|uniref:Uncharacterized protein n=1 Tax=Rhizophagus irregularis TaxID=588596 RepID=A0A916E1D6_9GLOM|nr:unnamed protein product [Rhizophagus irregularis]
MVSAYFFPSSVYNICALPFQFHIQIPILQQLWHLDILVIRFQDSKAPAESRLLLIEITHKPKVQDAHLEGRTPISKIQDVTEIRFKRK